ncbi:hypothetical protein [Actinomadura soli]|nr:hypothetical protein [Actinomadura soli]
MLAQHRRNQQMRTPRIAAHRQPDQVRKPHTGGTRPVQEPHTEP